MRVDESSDTSVEASQHNRFRQRAPHGPNPSNSPDEDNPVDLSATQATFLAGAAVTQAHHAATIADHASNVAIQSQLEAFQARQVIAQQQSDFGQVAAEMRDAAARAILHNQEEAHAALAERDRGSELFEHNLTQQAQQLIFGARQHAQQEVLESQAVLQREAQQFVESSVRPLQHQINLGNQQLATREVEITERDTRIALLEHELAEARRQHNLAVASPVPVSPISGSALMDLLADLPQENMGQRVIPEEQTMENFDLFEGYVPAPAQTPDVRARPFGSPQNTSAPLQEVANPMVVEATTWATPRVSVGQSSHEVAPNVVPSMPQSFHPPGATPATVMANPQPAELAVANLSMPTNVMVPSANVASGSNPTESALVQQLLAEVSRLTNALQSQQQQLQQMQQQPQLTAHTPLPIAPPCTPPKGAAASAPGLGPTNASAAGTPCANSRFGSIGRAPPPQQVLPPGLPPLPLAQQGLVVDNTTCYHHIGSANRSVDSGSSESSSDSGEFHSVRAPLVLTECRICGDLHEEIECPHLTMNQPYLAPQPPAVNYADDKEDTIRVKSLADMVFPNPPENAGQARGYINQVLMSIGKLQKTPGNEVYQWAQECLTNDETVLQADPRYPRTDREIASRLIKTCKRGRFGLVFQQMVEAERAASGAMPCGRAMLRKILKHFQLERDRIGMLGERNLLSLKVAGNTVADLEAFRDKYIYVMSTIPLEDMPRQQTLFNHLIDELERNTVIAPKVVKAREARLDSHRRTTDWLWSKVDLAVQLDQQKRNRAEFDKQLKLKPAAGYAGTQHTPDDKIAGAPAPTPNPKAKATPKSQGSGGGNPNPKPNKIPKENVKAAPAPKAKPKAKPSGPKPPPPNRKGNTTPRGEEARKVAKMSASEKAKIPCMFYAYNACKAKSCAFLHSDTNKYKGPPPRALGKSGKAPAKAAASMATVIIPEVAADGATNNPDPINAMPMKTSKSIPWLWDTAAGRHLIGRQALTPAMKEHLQQSPNPVAFATGGGSQPGQESLAFNGSKILEGEEVYVLKECPPAQSIGKTVIDKGYMFVWDPRENVPYLIAPENINRCRMKVPRNARICASRVVEYVPQYDEELTPRHFVPSEHLHPVSTAVPAPPVETDAPADNEEDPNDPGYAPSFGGSDLPSPSELDEILDPEPVEDAAGPASASEPKHPMDNKLLVELGDGDPPKDEVLKQHATSPEHLRTHFPKNPYCPLCHIAKDTAMRVSHVKDGKADDFVDPPKQPLEQLATDDVILAKGSEHLGVGIGGIRSHHVIRDAYSGARVAYPLSKRTADAHARNFRHFLGLRGSELTTRTFIKMDEAGELEQAAHAVGMVPETSLPNRWPHNAILERDVREEKECCRTIHLQSGLPYEYHTYSYPYACLSMSFDKPSIADPDKTQWESLTRNKFDGMRLCFGQLVYYRRKSPTKRTLEPNMSPGLFSGWRIDPGFRYRNVLRVLDYQEYRTRGGNSAVDVPEAEIFVPEGDPVFPVGFSRHQALIRGDNPDDLKLPEYALKDVPFPKEGGIASPSTPGLKSRSVYITVDRILKWKETPGCKGCTGHSRAHTDECRARFSMLVEKEKEAEREKKAPPPESEIEAEDKDDEAHGIIFQGEDLPDPIPSHLSAEDRELFDEIFIRGEVPGSAEPSAPPEPAVSVSGVAILAQVANRCSDLCQKSLPVFGCPAVGKLTNRDNRRSRKAAKKASRPNAKSTMFEFACSEDSQIGFTHQEYGINHVRLCKDRIDLGDESQCEQLDYQIDEAAKVAPPHMWASIPCTSGSPWQYINRKKGGAAFMRKLARQVKESKRLFSSFAKRAERVLNHGGTVTFEWPRPCSGWKRPDVVAFFEKHPQFMTVGFEGCTVGLIDRNGYPIKKPWKLKTTSSRIVEAFQDMRCRCQQPHSRCEGAETTRSAMYPPQMTNLIAQALYPSKCAQQPVPAMPCQPATSEPQPHREIEQHLKHVSPLAGFEDLAIAVESNPTANRLVTELLDHEQLIAQALHLEDPKAPTPEIKAMVTKLLSRAEMLSNPKALEAIRAEADGLVKAGTWDLGSVREKEDVRKEAKASGVSVHFGQLMTIASIKFYELADHLHKMKGRIVYRGDCAKDEHGAAAVYQELGANPTSVQGLNACLAYGSLPGNRATAADAVKAYVQALLSSKYKTWIELPPELRPKYWKQQFVKPVVLLIKALYGHPDAGGLWEQHLKVIIKNLGGQEVPEYPGNFYFPDTKLLLSTYVDDLTLAGPADQHDAFWSKLTSVVDIEPPEPIYRILGRNHVVTPLSKTEGHDKCAAFQSQTGMVFDMADYAQQTVDLYKSITGVTKLKHAATPFPPEGSITIEDDETKGELAPNACKILMKALWLGRLARPDIIKPINDLTTKVQSWSRGDDKKVLRLIQYIASTPHYRLVDTIQDKPEDLELKLFVDADFAGDRSTARSTSGGFLALTGPSSFFPLAWISKRQTSTSRSTTESEVVSLAYSLYQEGLPALQLWELLLARSVTLRVHEDNQATILVVKKGYSPKLRHITRTHKVNLSCLSEIFRDDSAEIEYIHTDDQAADIFTKALPPHKWAAALILLGIRTDLPLDLKSKA